MGLYKEAGDLAWLIDGAKHLWATDSLKSNGGPLGIDSAVPIAAAALPLSLNAAPECVGRQLTDLTELEVVLGVDMAAPLNDGGGPYAVLGETVSIPSTGPAFKNVGKQPTDF